MKWHLWEKPLSWKGLRGALGNTGKPAFKPEIDQEKLNDVADKAFSGSKDLILLLNGLHDA